MVAFFVIAIANVQNPDNVINHLSLKFLFAINYMLLL